MFHGREVPFNLQAVARLLRSPEFVGDNCDTRALDEWNLEYVANAFSAASGCVVQALDAPSKHRRMRDDRGLHAGQIQVQSKLERAVAFGAAIKPPYPFPHQAELRRILQLDRGGNRLLGCRFRQFSVCG